MLSVCTESFQHCVFQVGSVLVSRRTRGDRTGGRATEVMPVKVACRGLSRCGKSTRDQAYTVMTEGKSPRRCRIDWKCRQGFTGSPIGRSLIARVNNCRRRRPRVQMPETSHQNHRHRDRQDRDRSNRAAVRLRPLRRPTGVTRYLWGKRRRRPAVPATASDFPHGRKGWLALTPITQPLAARLSAISMSSTP